MQGNPPHAIRIDGDPVQVHGQKLPSPLGLTVGIPRCT